jgi:hypothetical protein
MYFSKYDDADEHWSSSNEKQRMEDIKGYLADETSYRGI